MKLLVLNGPNLNLLGTREVDVYGKGSLSDLESSLRQQFAKDTLEFFQSNVEGELIDALHAAAAGGTDAVVLNPAGYSHTSVAIRDAIAAIEIPVVEVHISNVHAREDFRHTSLTGAVCEGVITGLGFDGYRLAVIFLKGRAAGAAP